MASRANSARSLSNDLSAKSVRLVDKLCDEYEQAWREGPPNMIEFVERGPATCRDYLLGELAGIELHYRRNSEGQPITVTGAPGALSVAGLCARESFGESSTG